MVVSLLLARAALAHGTAFGAVALAPDPVDPDTAWAIVEGWGLALTRDGGASWAWHCEESLVSGDAEPQPVLSVLARPATGPGTPARAWVGTRTGLLAVDSACGVTPVPGLPEGAYVAAIGALDDDSALVLATGPLAGGAYRCDDAGCAPTELLGDGLFPKSLARARSGGTWWATTVDEGSLAARLWRSTDGESWDEVPGPDGGARWPGGDVDPRLLEAEGDRLLVWARTRVDGDTPRLLRSADAGRSWVEVLTHGSWQDPAAGFVRTGDALFVGSVRGARTWRSGDDGRSWEDVSRSAPAVRCGAEGPSRVWLCADHIADGYDVAVSEGGDWAPVGCLQEAAAPACAEPACGVYAEVYAQAGALGGAVCATDLEEAADSGCGCASGGGFPLVGAWLAGVALVGRRRLRARS